MPLLNPKAFEAEVRSGRVGPLYLLVGEETYLREKALHALIDAALRPAVRPFNLDIFRGGETPPGEIAERIQSFPLMAARRVVVVKACDELNEGAVRLLLPVVESPPETSTVVFVGDKADGRKRLFAALRKAACTVEFKPLREREAVAWVQERLKALGKRLSQEAIPLFIGRVGGDLGVAAGEIDKLVSFLGDRQVIEREDVEGVVGVSAEVSIFDLTDAVGAKDAGRALAVLRRILEAGERGGGVLWRLTQHVHTLMRVRMLREVRVPEKDLPDRLGLPSFVVTKYLNQVRKFSPSDLWRAYEALATAEDHLKSGYQTEEIVLQLLIRALCR
ncbi:MAG: DNA polymerase III subunit delta [Candidatus Handelsmanbacteria bacterium RIFCSPLOWO2_12_FULL_64_10]|uniref:DNA polymerase III subunit delta n=1 Tax=Handelsmanbacteria sp. (strain RIFCSPLOWO2_12_FULL_64_10) TaxID=1817868 RepID=A0A1F6CUI3_HANXR|nr:MAG: DNA polymerase III subunit delta [Candidatus Handelsmanbacteria bacterium RIFCSPLOWO2_12_FULL_64_10]